MEHLKYHNDDEDNLIVLNHHWNVKRKRSVMQLFLHSGNLYEDCSYIDFDRLLWRPVNREILLAGSCNGIVCLEHKRSFDIALWNPALEQLKPLPQPWFSSRCHESSAYSYSYGAFGIDVKTNDFKVMKIFTLLSRKYGLLDNQIEVYSLRNDCWKIIHKNKVLPFLKTCYFDVISPCANGKCFWIRRGNHSPNLITFDFTDEVFGTMSLPEGAHDPSDPCKLDIYDDKLIYIKLGDDYNRFEWGNRLEIWMLCEDGLKESWSKIFMLEPYLPMDRMISPVGLSKNGGYFICKKFDRNFELKLYLYNLHTQEGKFLQSDAHQVVRYNPSLISLKSANDI